MVDVTVITKGRIERHNLCWIRPHSDKAKRYAKQYYRQGTGVNPELWQHTKGGGYLFHITGLDAFVNALRYYGLEVTVDPELE